ncbi:hypothetical protein [Paenibacillus sp. PL2-23]|uniref:hypothetical protein n=1 Tax=Paenibacillus sp. PL2-23 TaxID=2100729 RepID=UPI0030FC70DB
MDRGWKQPNARLELAELGRRTGEELTDMVQYVEELERKCSELEGENALLKTELSKLKDVLSRRTAPAAAMNSRLKDALRE